MHVHTDDVRADSDVSRQKKDLIVGSRAQNENFDGDVKMKLHKRKGANEM